MRIEHGTLEVRRQRLLVGDEVMQICVVGGSCIGVANPLVKMSADARHQDGNEHERDQRKRARHRLQRTAQQQPPLAARYILQHQHHKRAAGKVEARHVAHQIGAEDVVAAPIGEREEQRQQREDSGDRERSPAPRQQHLRRGQRRRKRARPVIRVCSVLSVLFVCK